MSDRPKNYATAARSCDGNFSKIVMEHQLWFAGVLPCAVRLWSDNDVTAALSAYLHVDAFSAPSIPSVRLKTSTSIILVSTYSTTFIALLNCHSFLPSLPYARFYQAFAIHFHFGLGKPAKCEFSSTRAFG